jgi:o-succinylbenzoate synthase
MYKAKYNKYILKFKEPSATSKGVLTEKRVFFVTLWDTSSPLKQGIGECNMLPGLSMDDNPGYEEKLKEVCNNLDSYQNNLYEKLRDFPSIYFGMETAIKDLENGGNKILYPSLFTEGKAGISINGLVWMGKYDFMLNQAIEKINLGYQCIKIKIGGINFNEELKLLETIREQHSAGQVTIRLDANGAFTPDDAMNKLKALAPFEINSIEQPIKAGQWERMAELCDNSPIPIVLDEELIGKTSFLEREKLISTIHPHYIVIKPSLVGGFRGSEEWHKLATEYNVGWWITSALESNIGLNAIAQWTYTLRSKLPQGLGTGQLYTNNIKSLLIIKNGSLWNQDSNNSSN